MKTTKKQTYTPTHVFSPDSFARHSTEWLADFARMSKAKQKVLLIEWDILNPDGTLRRYPMDHVPLGPRN